LLASRPAARRARVACHRHLEKRKVHHIHLPHTTWSKERSSGHPWTPWRGTEVSLVVVSLHLTTFHLHRRRISPAWRSSVVKRLLQFAGVPWAKPHEKQRLGCPPRAKCRHQIDGRLGIITNTFSFTTQQSVQNLKLNYTVLSAPYSTNARNLWRLR